MTFEEANKIYNEELKKIEKMEATNETKAIYLAQLNRTMTEMLKAAE